MINNNYNLILDMVREKEKFIENNFIHKMIRNKYYDFIARNINKPTEIRMNVKMYESITMLASHSNPHFNSGVIEPIRYMDMEIVIDQSLEDFEVVGYREFINGIKKVIR